MEMDINLRKNYLKIKKWKKVKEMMIKIIKLIDKMF